MVLVIVDVFLVLCMNYPRALVAVWSSVLLVLLCHVLLPLFWVIVSVNVFSLRLLRDILMLPTRARTVGWNLRARRIRQMFVALVQPLWAASLAVLVRPVRTSVRMAFTLVSTVVKTLVPAGLSAILTRVREGPVTRSVCF